MYVYALYVYVYVDILLYRYLVEVLIVTKKIGSKHTVYTESPSFLGIKYFCFFTFRYTPNFVSV